MRHSMFLIGYDISDNANRRRALRLLRANSISYQDSVFEVVATPEQLSVLMNELQTLILAEDDRLFCVRLKSSSACWQLGSGEMSPTGDFLVIM